MLIGENKISGFFLGLAFIFPTLPIWISLMVAHSYNDRLLNISFALCFIVSFLLKKMIKDLKLLSIWLFISLAEIVTLIVKIFSERGGNHDPNASPFFQIFLITMLISVLSWSGASIAWVINKYNQIKKTNLPALFMLTTCAATVLVFINIFHSSINLILIIIAFLFALIYASFSKGSILQATLTISLAVIISLIINIVKDTINDPTSHNLLPFEIIIYSAFILTSSLLGSMIPQIPSLIKSNYKRNDNK